MVTIGNSQRQQQQQQQQQTLLSKSIRRHFPWSTTTNKVSSTHEVEEEDETTTTTAINNNNPTSLTSSIEETLNLNTTHKPNPPASPPPQGRKKKKKEKKKLAASVAVERFRAAVAALRQGKNQEGPLGHRVVGTLFGHRRGNVNFALQGDPNSSPVFFVELATSITSLVKEMTSVGLVRIALECKKSSDGGGGGDSSRIYGSLLSSSNARRELMGETVWKAYCNGKQCGYAKRKEMGAAEAKIMKAVEPISMGAGILGGFNGSGGCGGGGELMYMRAKFERVVGSRDSEAFYMMNPDRNGAPELSVYLLRV